jgi:hypothetical protein
LNYESNVPKMRKAKVCSYFRLLYSIDLEWCRIVGMRRGYNLGKELLILGSEVPLL